MYEYVQIHWKKKKKMLVQLQNDCLKREGYTEEEDCVIIIYNLYCAKPLI